LPFVRVKGVVRFSLQDCQRAFTKRFKS
jgi:hypothetical protein